CCCWCPPSICAAPSGSFGSADTFGGIVRRPRRSGGGAGTAPGGGGMAPPAPAAGESPFTVFDGMRVLRSIFGFLRSSAIALLEPPLPRHQGPIARTVFARLLSIHA